MSGIEVTGQSPETSVHESRLAEGVAAYKAPENHLFRKAYRQLSDAEKLQMDAIKDRAWALRCAILGTDAENPPKSREQSLAMTKLEEAVMWAVKHVTQ